MWSALITWCEISPDHCTRQLWKLSHFHIWCIKVTNRTILQKLNLQDDDQHVPAVYVFMRHCKWQFNTGSFCCAVLLFSHTAARAQTHSEVHQHEENILSWPTVQTTNQRNKRTVPGERMPGVVSISKHCLRENHSLELLTLFIQWQVKTPCGFNPMKKLSPVSSFSIQHQCQSSEQPRSGIIFFVQKANTKLKTTLITIMLSGKKVL